MRKTSITSISFFFLLFVSLISFMTACGGGGGAGGVASSGTTPTAETGATLISISVEPPSISVPTGVDVTFHAYGSYSDGTTRDITSSVTWSTSNAGATVSSGIANGASAGTSTVTATSGDVTGAATLAVQSATLVSIDVAPVDRSKAPGLSQQFTATGNYSDGATYDITTQATWESSTPGVATINNSGLATAVAAGNTTISASLGGKKGSTGLTVTAANIDSISVAPASLSVPLGAKANFTATASLSDGTAQDVTNAAAWSSSDNATAIVNGGVVSPLRAGQVTITANYNGKTASSTLTITTATVQSIEFTNAGQTVTSISVPKGATLNLKATAVYTDNARVEVTNSATWTSDKQTIATVTNGAVKGVSPGSANVNATSNGVTGSVQVTVTAAQLTSVAVSPASAIIAKGAKQQFHVTGTYSDGSTVTDPSGVTWTSSDTSVATITNVSSSTFSQPFSKTVPPGLATGIAPGTVTITAKLGTKTATASLEVSSGVLQSIKVTPLDSTLANGGKTRQFTATGTYSDGATTKEVDLTDLATWTSSNNAIVTIGSTGLATSTATATGTGTISAKYGTVNGSTPIAIVNATDIGSKWTSHSYTSSQLNSVVWAKDRYFAVGNGGLVVTSETSHGWLQRASNVTTDDLLGITWSGSSLVAGKLVAVGKNGEILTSDDGTTWTSRKSAGDTSTYRAVRAFQVFNGKAFETVYVIVGDSGVVRTSKDGIIWTAQTSKTTKNLYGIARSGSKYVAVGDVGAIITSPDGVTWTPVVSGTTDALTGVTWSGSKFVAVSQEGIILTSSDGATWTVGPRSNITDQGNTITAPLYLNGVTWSGDKFVAVGAWKSTKNSKFYPLFLHSADGVSWKQASSPAVIFNGFGADISAVDMSNQFVLGVTWSQERTEFMAVGDNTGNTQNVIYSSY